MLTLTNELLQKSSEQRLLEAANYKLAYFMPLLADSAELGLKQNAELIDIVTIRGNSRYNARAIFRIDTHANPLPAGYTARAKRFMDVGVDIMRISGEDLAAEYGIAGTLYLGLTAQQVPADTTGLATILADKFGLIVQASDIISFAIAPGLQTVIVEFSSASIAYTGRVKVDLRTPIV